MDWYNDIMMWCLWCQHSLKVAMVVTCSDNVVIKVTIPLSWGSTSWLHRFLLQGHAILMKPRAASLPAQSRSSSKAGCFRYYDRRRRRRRRRRRWCKCDLLAGSQKKWWMMLSNSLKHFQALHMSQMSQVLPCPVECIRRDCTSDLAA